MESKIYECLQVSECVKGKHGIHIDVLQANSELKYA